MRPTILAGILLACSASACGGDHGAPVKPPPLVAIRPAASSPPNTEKPYPSRGRVEASIMEEEGVASAIDPEQLKTLAGCHARGLPLGWVILRVKVHDDTSQRTAQLVEYGGISESTAQCVRVRIEQMQLGHYQRLFLVYARLL